ncbi:MAG TPA: hypothetical protein VNP04_32460 [Alphaproteobacteria bacterium]|nr:hypothetical protein [Alphaproteobacteria bacterium]
MPLTETPQAATNIIAFGGTPDGAAKINYSVPQPGVVRNRRILALDNADLGLTDSDWNTTAKNKTVLPTKDQDLKQIASDPDASLNLYTQLLKSAGIRMDKVIDFAQAWAALKEGERTAGAERPLVERRLSPQPGPGPTGPVFPPVDPRLLNGYLEFKQALGEGRLTLPYPDANGDLQGNSPPPSLTPKPQLFLVEYYDLSSFLGDYGLGRTIKTFTLMPGEAVSIRVRTWRSSETRRRESSSIFDSFGAESNNRFTGSVQRETTDRQTQSEKLGWHVEGTVNASWGWGNATVSGGANGEYHGSRESFASSVMNAAQEHAQSASSKREASVESSTESTEKVENEESVEREIRNVNLRRTLNFVFRELNQEYLVKLSLVEIRVAFSNGTPGSWREVPLPGLRTLLTDTLTAPNKVDATAQTLLGVIGTVFDESDAPQETLELITMAANGGGWTVTPAQRDATGKFPEPTHTRFYRFKRGAIGQEDKPQRVKGVLMREDKVVLRTDSVVVEALLGQADALDEYAMLSQKADAEAKDIANARNRLINETLDAITDEKERLEVYSKIVVNQAPVRIDLNHS